MVVLLGLLGNDEQFSATCWGRDLVGWEKESFGKGLNKCGLRTTASAREGGRRVSTNQSGYKEFRHDAVRERTAKQRTRGGSDSVT